MKYFNQDGVEVTKNIVLGKTKKFQAEQKQQAEQYAAHRRSYVYDLFIETRRVKRQFYGFAVPN